jgi:hypothetical protein
VVKRAGDPRPTSTEPQTSKLAGQALKWIAEAKLDKGKHKEWLDGVYRYCMPWRVRDGSTQQQHDQDDLFDSTAIEALSDFSADMQTTFTPVEDDWLDVEVAQGIENFTKAQLKPKLDEYKATVFAEVRRSNFHEASQESYPDLGAGTCAMIIQDTNINDPVQCQAIPITDLLICRGVHGGADFRSRRNCNMKLRDLKPTYPNAKIPARLLRKAETNPGAVVEVNECFWRLWDKPGIERWQYVLLIDSEEAEATIWEGAGSCPIIVARWRTDSTTAWGIGALYVVLPTIQTLDQLNYLIMKRMSFVVDPAFFYDDDSVVNLDNGINPGDGIPRAIGSKFDVFESEADFNTAFFERKDMQQDIKRALFQDKPQQSGDTPPTAAQWMDQKAEIARRMGAPIGRLTTEWQWAIFQRFAYLMEQRGKLPEVKLNGEVVRLRPQSPLVKAQRQQKVMIAERLIGAINTSFQPELSAVIMDPIQTAKNLQDQLGDSIVVLRTQPEIDDLVAKGAALAQQQGLLPGPDGGAQGGAPVPGKTP